MITSWWQGGRNGRCWLQGGRWWFSGYTGWSRGWFTRCWPFRPFRLLWAYSITVFEWIIHCVGYNNIRTFNGKFTCFVVESSYCLPRRTNLIRLGNVPALMNKPEGKCSFLFHSVSNVERSVFSCGIV